MGKGWLCGAVAVPVNTKPTSSHSGHHQELSHSDNIGEVGNVQQRLHKTVIIFPVQIAFSVIHNV